MTDNPGLTDLISYWPLDETSGMRYDAHGSNDLTDINTVGYRTGVQANAGDFVKTNLERLIHTDNTDLSIPSGQSFTLALWVYLDSLPGAGATSPLSKMKDGTTNAEYRLWVSSDGRHQFILRKADDSGNSTAQSPVSTFTAGAWHFWRAGYDASANTIYTQIDMGTLYSLGSLPAMGLDGDHDFWLGGWDSAIADRMWLGGIDEVAFYKRWLTDAEATWLYNSAAGRTYAEISTPPPTPPKSAWLTGRLVGQEQRRRAPEFYP